MKIYSKAARKVSESKPRTGRTYILGAVFAIVYLCRLGKSTYLPSYYTLSTYLERLLTYLKVTYTYLERLVKASCGTARTYILARLGNLPAYCIQRNLFKSNINQIVFTVFRLMWNQTDFRLVSNQSESGKLLTENYL